MPAPHPQLREKLVAASLAMVESHGLALFSLRKVAGRVGVSPSAVYRHFRDKEDLLTAIVEDGVVHIVALQARYLSAAGDDPLRQLEAMGLAQIRFAWLYPTHFRLLHMPEYSRADRSEIIAGSRPPARPASSRCCPRCPPWASRTPPPFSSRSTR